MHFNCFTMGLSRVILLLFLIFKLKSEGFELHYFPGYDISQDMLLPPAIQASSACELKYTTKYDRIITSSGSFHHIILKNVRYHANWFIVNLFRNGKGRLMKLLRFRNLG